MTALTPEQVIRRASFDPGQHVPRGENYSEPLPSWQARAVLAALEANGLTVVAQAEVERLRGVEAEFGRRRDHYGIGWHRATELAELIDQVVILSLAYAEKKYGHDDAARLNLEAGIADVLRLGLPHEEAARLRAAREHGPAPVVLDDADTGAR